MERNTCYLALTVAEAARTVSELVEKDGLTSRMVDCHELRQGDELRGMVLIFESFFHRRCRGKRFWEILLLWYFCNVCLQFGPWSGQTALVMSVGSCLVNFALILASYRARWDRAFFVAVTAYALGSAPNYWMDRIAMVLFGLTYDELVWNIPLYSAVFVARSLVGMILGWLIWRLHKPLPCGDGAPRVWVPLATVFPLMTLVAFYGLYYRSESR